MDHQATGSYADALPQLPDVAIGFPGLQLQPHAESPTVSNSDGSESMGVDPPAARLPRLAGSACSLSTAADMADARPEAGASTPCDGMEIKIEHQVEALQSEQLQVASAAAAVSPAAPADSKSGAEVAALAQHADVQLMLCQPAAALPSLGVPLTGVAGISPWVAAVSSVADTQTHQAALSHLVSQHGAADQQQQQQAQLLLANAAAQPAANPFILATGASHTAEAPVLRNSGGSRAMQRTHSHEGNSSGCSRFQVSHSTVEKQRRDRLNSLIDELSDIVPPADPKYGNDSSSVRRPKHVVLSDTINLLKAMQAKLQLEEAEICTLKQQAAAVVAMAASQQHQQLPTVNNAAGGVSGGGVAQTSSEMAVLPAAPESCASTGVLVEQGVNCLFVKVNCKDRKGLLADVVSALKAFPIVISTAAITTTKEGTVHDVFEVRIEDENVTPEDIQCAVHMALFSSDRERRSTARTARVCWQMWYQR
eukprot:GHUV01013098.1.p1 GENE.GHUV01013098.1~~GHUV01013098.1.p1  ORF type:complete len:481 (+),score=152.21 GHUV01013098.1:1302-2744(+)